MSISSGLVSERLFNPLPLFSTEVAVQRDTATSSYSTTTVTADATVDTKGTWVELVASAPWDVSGFDINIAGSTGLSANRLATLLDIGVGPASSEVVLLPDFQCGWLANSLLVWGPFFPLRIRAGSRIAVRIQSSYSSNSITLNIGLYRSRGLVRSYNSVRAIGVVSTGSEGTFLTRATSINTKSAWTTLEDPTPSPIRGLMWGISPEWQPSFTNNVWRLVDVGIGAAGSEVVLLPDIVFQTNQNETVQNQSPRLSHYPVRVDIPAGVRLSARYATVNTNAGTTLSLYGFS